VRRFVEEGLGNTSYLVADEEKGVAAVIDPLRDVDLYTQAAQELGVRITHILETHVHNDFVSGSRELAAWTGATIHASAQAELRFEYVPLREGDQILLGSLRIDVLETPGHTPEHFSYTVSEPGSHQPKVLFSGGSLLVGSVSRTDLLGEELAEPLAQQLYHSLQEKIMTLPDEVEVYPTHGAGSFCAVGTHADRTTTIGRERRTNPLLKATSPQDFARRLLTSLSSYPAYFGRMKALNQEGPPILGRLPILKPLSVQAVREEMGRGTQVLDMRHPRHFAAGHIPGSYHVALRSSFVTWVGWVVPPGRLILISEDTGRHEEAVRQLIRIGYDDLAGYLEGGLAAWEAAGLPVERAGVLDVRELYQRLERGDLALLDVRQDSEWEGGHVAQAHHIELGSLVAEAERLPRGQPIATICGGGFRSSTALSILERLGFRNLYNVKGGMDAWRKAGLPLE
jgi:hydroxyacylglutathione hydrolase